MGIFKNSELVQIDGEGSIRLTNYKGFEIWKISSNRKGIADIFDIMDCEVSINANHEYINHESGKKWYSYLNIENLISDIDNYIRLKNSQLDLVLYCMEF
jgi:hypothetical protein